jgi:ABC-2 type transport system ATP-binding protein
MMKTALELRGIEKSFKTSLTKPPSQILKNISFSVKQGSITAFLGANGAGKTTTFKCILGLVFPDAGDIHYFDKQTLSNSVKAKIGFMPERPQFPEYLSGEEFLLYYLNLYQRIDGISAKQKVERSLKTVGLLDAKKRLLKNYSKGMIQRVGIAQAIIHEPELVILDEPMSGLDPDGRYEVSQLILDIHKSGKTVFFSSHLLDDVQKLCEQLIIVKSGQTIFEGSKLDFLSNNKSAFRITYLEGASSKYLEVDGVEILNKKLDELRQRNCSVIEVTAKNTLEHAYVTFQKEKV